MNPIATMHMANGAKIVIELLPEYAPNTVNSFINAVKKGVYVNHEVERIVPGSWVDLSFTGFKKKEGQYLIPYESKLHPEITPLDTTPGCVCMGGYGDLGESGCEVFFPVRNCPEHKGVYPVFGKVLEGMEEVYRLEQVETKPVTDFPIKNIEVNTPVEPQVILRVELDLKGKEYPEPVKINEGVLTPSWKQYWEKN